MSEQKMHAFFKSVLSNLTVFGAGQSMTRFMLVSGLLAASAGAMAQSDPIVGICTNCSTAGFAWTAEQAAPPTAGNYPVYVIDSVDGEVRYFDVDVWWDCGGNDLESHDPKDAKTAEGSGLVVQSYCVQKESITGAGSQSIIMNIQDAHYGVKEFASLHSVDIDTVDLPGFSGNSAIDLLGPAGSSSDLARAALQNSVNNYHNTWWGVITVSWADMSRRFANRFIGSSNYLSPMSSLTIHFPDGTSIKVNITQVSTGIDGSVTMQIEIQMDSGQFPDGSPIPYAEGHFNGFQHNGDPDIIDSLRDLAQLYGIPITGGGGGGRIACVAVDGEIVSCEVLP